VAKGKYQKWLEPEGLILLEGWARDGLTDKEIADKMGITKSTFYVWKKEFSDFSDSLKKGKEVIDYEVEKALIKAACGYMSTEIIRERDPKNGEMVVVKEVTRFVPPNVTALIFWLKNRRPDKWRDKVDNVNIEQDSELKINIIGIENSKSS